MKKVFIWGVLTGIFLILIWNILCQSIFPTTVYTLKKELVLDNGSVLSKGTKLTKTFCFPPLEWYQPFNLGITIIKDDSDKYFKREFDRKSNIKINYQVK